MRDFDVTAIVIGLTFIGLGVALGGDALDWWRTEPGAVAAVGVVSLGAALVLGTLWRDRPRGEGDDRHGG